MERQPKSECQNCKEKRAHNPNWGHRADIEILFDSAYYGPENHWRGWILLIDGTCYKWINRPEMIRVIDNHIKALAYKHREHS